MANGKLLGFRASVSYSFPPLTLIKTAKFQKSPEILSRFRYFLKKMLIFLFSSICCKYLLIDTILFKQICNRHCIASHWDWDWDWDRVKIGLVCSENHLRHWKLLPFNLYRRVFFCFFAVLILFPETVNANFPPIFRMQTTTRHSFQPCNIVPNSNLEDVEEDASS